MKALIVDDDSSVRFMLKRLVSSLGCTAVEASDGAVALQILPGSGVSFVVLDMKMPRLGGLELLQSIRKSREYSQLPVVIITGKADEFTTAEVLKLGISDFLVKPLRIELAQARLRHLMQTLEKNAVLVPSAEKSATPK